MAAKNTKKPAKAKKVNKKTTKRVKPEVTKTKAVKKTVTKTKSVKTAKKTIKTKANPIEQKIKNAQKNQNLVIGTRTVIKSIKKGLVTSVFHATNVPENLLKDLDYYVEISGIDVEKFNGNSAQLGEFCGKPFKILLTAIKK